MERAPCMPSQQRIQRVRIPVSARSTPLFQHLRLGQKRYLYSITQVYDSQPMREMIYHRYAYYLQRQNLLGHLSHDEVARYVSVLRQPEKDPYDSKGRRGRRTSSRK